MFIVCEDRYWHIFIMHEANILTFQDFFARII